MKQYEQMKRVKRRGENPEASQEEQSARTQPGLPDGEVLVWILLDAEQNGTALDLFEKRNTAMEKTWSTSLNIPQLAKLVA